MNTRFLRLLLAAAIIVPAGAVAQVSNYREIKYPALPKFEIPKPVIFTLKNGLRVFLMEDHELPLIEATARIRTGSNYEPADKTGLAGLMGEVQRTGGTSSRSGDDLDDFLAARAANIETGAGGDASFARMDCLKDDFDEVFKAYCEVLRSPAFAQEKLELAKVAENTGISRRNDNVGAIASRELAKLVYGKTSPLARPAEYATIAAVTRNDLIAWHKKYYLPNNILLGVSGDFKADEMKRKLEAAFENWERGSDLTAPPVAYEKELKPGVYFVEKSDVNQANLVFGHLGIQTANPDFFAVQVMNEVLGGGFASRMFSNVRSKKGLAYNVYGALGSDFNQPGLFRAGLQTKSSTTIKAIEAVKAEITGIIEQAPTPDELKRAKDAILNSFVFHYDSRGKILSQQMTYAFYGLPADFLDQYQANIEKITAADVSRVAKKYVHPDKLALLVVGKAADFDQPLSTVGQVTTLDISIPPPPDTTPKAEKTPATLAAGKEVWLRVVKAMGGAALKSAASLKSTADVSLKVGGQSMALKQSTDLIFPDQARQAVNTPMGSQTIVLDGKEGFTIAGEKAQPLPPAMLEEHTKDQARNLIYLFHYFDDPGLEIVAAGTEKIDGVECQILAASFKGVDSRLWVTPEAKVVRQAYQGTNPMTRAPGMVENVLSDFKTVGGMLVPFQQTRRMDGKEVMTITLNTFELNAKIDPELFKKPAP